VGVDPLNRFAVGTIIQAFNAHQVVHVYSHLNSNMERIQTWIARSRMRLNIRKSSVM